MITVKDFQKAERKPNACKDEQGRLRVGAAVGAGAGNEERVDALVAAGVNVLLIDSSHGHSEGVLQRIRETRAKYPDLQIIGGNVATAAGARALAEAGCSAVKVGIGPGFSSVQTTVSLLAWVFRRSLPLLTQLKPWKAPYSGYRRWWYSLLRRHRQLSPLAQARW
ncbi:IMP dehydrogenase [Escherichia coli]